jgi:anti-sigma factor RsiW
MTDSERTKILMMGYVDGELTSDERKELLTHCAADPELARELSKYKNLARISDAMKLAEPIDEAARSLAKNRGYRVARAAGSVAAVLGFLGVAASLVLDFFDALPPRLMPCSLGGMIGGSIVFSAAELWARRRLLALDDYREVRR